MKKIVLKFILSWIIILSIFLSFNFVKAISIEYHSDNVEKVQTELNKTYVTSQKYMISELYSYIGRILPRTTIAQFKMSFNIASEKIHVYTDDSLSKEVTSKYIATGMIIKFDGNDKTYSAIVIGDLNNDGICNQIEIQKLIRHIIGIKEEQLTGLQLLCVDVNNDGKVNQIDLTRLINYVVFGRLNLEGAIKPSKPEITVTGGELGDSGWYLTKPNIRITETCNTNVEKTVYKITGSKDIEETVIPDDGIINIEEDGTYIITAYTYSTLGEKSEIAQVEIKLCTTKIEDEDFGLEMRLNNQEGEQYISNTWTNKNVYIMPKAFNVDSKLDLSYKLIGNTTLTVPSKEDITIENEGETTVILTAVDDIGRKKVKEYKILIDKTLPISSSIVNIEGNMTETGFYNTDVKLTIQDGSDYLSGINKITYEFQGDIQQSETELNEERVILITGDTVTKVIIRTYDVAGNISQIEKTINRDVTPPQNISVTATDVTGFGYRLTARATDVASGILKYEFYINGNKYETISSSQNEVSIDVTNQESGEKQIKVIVTDNVGNSAESEIIEVDLEKLSLDEIDHVEFLITGYSKENNEAVLDESSIDAIISDTSLTNTSKFIQITVTQNGSVGTVTGKVRIIRKDGMIEENLSYFPEDMLIMTSHISSGSGTGWRHYTKNQLFGTNVYEGNVLTEITRSASIRPTVGENIFRVIEKKIVGVNTYTRFIIEKVIIGEKELEFKICQ